MDIETTKPRPIAERGDTITLTLGLSEWHNDGRYRRTRSWTVGAGASYRTLRAAVIGQIGHAHPTFDWSVWGPLANITPDESGSAETMEAAEREANAALKALCANGGRS